MTPRRRLQVCAIPGCPTLVRGTYCHEHAPTRKRTTGWTDGSTWAWRKTRARILKRDNNRCRYCGAPATTVDHIVPKSNGGSDHDSNLAAACRDCNNRKANSTTGWRTTPSTPSSDSAAPPFRAEHGSQGREG
jgi:5-methylcytosine-specific restriction endonuclease McrA